MTIPAPFRLVPFEEPTAVPGEKSFTTDKELSVLVEAMWKSFPGARSERELACLWADHLSQSGFTVSDRAVQYWLRRRTSPHFRYMRPIAARVREAGVKSWP